MEADKLYKEANKLAAPSPWTLRLHSDWLGATPLFERAAMLYKVIRALGTPIRTLGTPIGSVQGGAMASADLPFPALALAAKRQSVGRHGLLREGRHRPGAPEVALARGQEHGEGR